MNAGRVSVTDLIANVNEAETWHMPKCAQKRAGCVPFVEAPTIYGWLFCQLPCCTLRPIGYRSVSFNQHIARDMRTLNEVRGSVPICKRLTSPCS